MGDRLRGFLSDARHARASERRHDCSLMRATRAGDLDADEVVTEAQRWLQGRK